MTQIFRLADVRDIMRHTTMEGTTMAEVFACKACGKPVSSEASACPHCGHPQKRSKNDPIWLRILIGFRRVIRWALLLGLVVGAGWVALRILGTSHEREYAANGMPKCTSSVAEADVQKTWENSPSRRVLGHSIVKFENPQALSESDAQHECRALVTLNNTQQYSLSYKFKKDSGAHYLIEVRIEGM
jgi:hypothetical protein